MHQDSRIYWGHNRAMMSSHGLRNFHCMCWAPAHLNWCFGCTLCFSLALRQTFNLDCHPPLILMTSLNDLSTLTAMLLLYLWSAKCLIFFHKPYFGQYGDIKHLTYSWVVVSMQRWGIVYTEQLYLTLGQAQIKNSETPGQNVL